MKEPIDFRSDIINTNTHTHKYTHKHTHITPHTFIDA